jgi:hypothetical protein
MCLQPVVYNTVASHMVVEMAPTRRTHTVSVRPAKASKVGTVISGAEAVPSDVKRNLLRCLGALPLARAKCP